MNNISIYPQQIIPGDKNITNKNVPACKAGTFFQLKEVTVYHKPSLFFPVVNTYRAWTVAM